MNQAEDGEVGPKPARIVLQFESPGSPKETSWDWATRGGFKHLAGVMYIEKPSLWGTLCNERLSRENSEPNATLPRVGPNHKGRVNPSLE